MKLHSAASERNQQPIIEILRRALPAQGTVLQIASGSGQHDLAFAQEFPQLRFQPTDRDDAALKSIEAHRQESGLANLLSPLHLDVLEDSWPVSAADALININMIHISPWPCCLALFRGAAKILPPGAPLFLYGPFVRTGFALEPSNDAFDRSLKSRNPQWGLRVMEDVVQVGKEAGFGHEETVPMPANNYSLVFRTGR